MNDEIELRHLRYFLAVAEMLHFGRAAKKLGMAQPPLSQQIRRLEEMLGAQLFERTTRGVTLTPAGSVLRERALSSMARLADDLEQTRRVARGEEGQLTVGFSGSVMFTELPMAIQAYRRAYPRVEVRLSEMWTSQQLVALADGSIDVGFLRDGERRPELQMTPLLREPFHVALPVGHRSAAAAEGGCGIARRRALRVICTTHGRAGLRPDDALLSGCRFSADDCAGGTAVSDAGPAGLRRAWNFTGAGVRGNDRVSRRDLPADPFEAVDFGRHRDTGGRGECYGSGVCGDSANALFTTNQHGTKTQRG